MSHPGLRNTLCYAEVILMSSFTLRPIRDLAFVALGALVMIPRAASGQQPAPEQRGILERRNDLIEVEEIVDHLGPPAQREAMQLLAFSLKDPEQVRVRLESRLKSRIDQLDRVCTLSKEQKNKLSVAGRGDIRRLFSQLEDLKSKLAPGGEIGPRFFAAVAEYRDVLTEKDCFGDGSLYAKILTSTLTPQQVAVREKTEREASISQHRSTIRWALGSMEPWLQLSQEQHNKLESLLCARTRAPRKFGAYDYYGLMFQASKLPEKELKSIFNDVQWQKIERQLAEARRLEQTLRTGGFLPDDDIADSGKTRQKGPIPEQALPRC